MAAEGMPIGEFSRRTGCAIETIRFYEKIGVLPVAQRRAAIGNMQPAMSDA
jgi:MerR family mercuric resistance operon transcriptional regulator